MKKTLSLILVLAMALGIFAGCGQNGSAETEPPATTVPVTEAPQTTEAALPAVRTFTDSTGRTVEIPEEITKISISGPLTQIYVLPLAGDMLVGVRRRFSETAQAYLPAEIYEKPEIGQL